MRLVKPDEPSKPQSSLFNAVVFVAFFIQSGLMLALRIKCDTLHKEVEMACELIRQHRIASANALAKEIEHR